MNVGVQKNVFERVVGASEDWDSDDGDGAGSKENDQGKMMARDVKRQKRIASVKLGYNWPRRLCAKISMRAINRFL